MGVFSDLGGGENPRKPSPEVGQDFADVVAAGATDGKEGIAESTFQLASDALPNGFYVAVLGFYGAAAVEVCDPTS